jgi:hypothetical protein
MIAKAREVDLLSYLRANEPHELIRTNSSEYRTKTHSSLVISHGLWYWNRGGVGGSSALDYLVKVRGMGFVEAVEAVCGEHAAPTTHIPQAEKALQRREFALPRQTRFASHALSYLQNRGISADVIGRCIQANLLYESTYRGAAVCVFVGRDENGRARCASLRGINSDLKQDVFGSDKRYSFYIPAENPDSADLTVYESPIDALSGATLQLHSDEVCDVFRLSLGGTSHIALVSFLERHPQIERTVLCLDADKAGREASDRILTLLSASGRFEHIRVTDIPPPVGKDYSDTLIHVLQQEQSKRNMIIRSSDRIIS